MGGAEGVARFVVRMEGEDGGTFSGRWRNIFGKMVVMGWGALDRDVLFELLLAAVCDRIIWAEEMITRVTKKVAHLTFIVNNLGSVDITSSVDCNYLSYTEVIIDNLTKVLSISQYSDNK